MFVLSTKWKFSIVSNDDTHTYAYIHTQIYPTESGDFHLNSTANFNIFNAVWWKGKASHTKIRGFDAIVLKERDPQLPDIRNILWMVAKSCITLDGWKPINNRMFTIYQLVQDFATIHRRISHRYPQRLAESELRRTQRTSAWGVPRQLTQLLSCLAGK